MLRKKEDEEETEADKSACSPSTNVLFDASDPAKIQEALEGKEQELETLEANIRSSEITNKGSDSPIYKQT